MITATTHAQGIPWLPIIYFSTAFMLWIPFTLVIAIGMYRSYEYKSNFRYGDAFLACVFGLAGALGFPVSIPLTVVSISVYYAARWLGALSEKLRWPTLGS